MTNQPNSTTHTVVMRRVRTMHALAPFFTTTAFLAVVFVVSVWAIGREVWVARVLRNMPSPTNVAAFLHFYIAAFLDTRFIVQVLSVIIVATFIWLAVSTAKMVKDVAQFA